MEAALASPVAPWNWSGNGVFGPMIVRANQATAQAQHQGGDADCAGSSVHSAPEFHAGSPADAPAAPPLDDGFDHVILNRHEEDRKQRGCVHSAEHRGTQ